MEAKVKEEGKVIDMSGAAKAAADGSRTMTPQEQQKAEREYKQRQQREFEEYKKNLKKGNELKKLQVEELELNIRYYDAKRKWLDLQPDVAKLDAEEQALIQKEQAAYEKAMKLKETAAKGAEKPDIVIPEVGKPRKD